MSLIAWWPLDGSTVNQGLESITLTSGTAIYSNGKIGQCLNSGTLRYSCRKDLVKEMTTSNTYSMAFWIKLTNAATGNWVVRIFGDNAAGNSRGLWHGKNATLAHWAYKGSGYNISHTKQIYDSKWHHICFVINKTNVKIYIDGVADGEINTNKTDVINLGSSNIEISSSVTQLNDVRIYNHCLSPREVGELAQGLILHYPMCMPDGIIGSIDVTVPNLWNNHIVYDASGYRHNATYADTSKPSWSNDSPVGLGSYVFDGSKTYLNAGTGAKVTDAITVSLWAYSSNWASGKQISCTEGGGWCFDPKDGKLRFSVYSGGAYRTIVTNTALTSLANGWHHITGSFDGQKIALYIDGVLEKEATPLTTKTAISYHSTNSILIGAEAAGGDTPATAGQYWNGKICDVRIYATALSAEDIERLYKVRTTIDNSGNLLTTSFIESSDITSSNITKTGLVKANTLTEEGEIGKISKDGSVKANKFYEFI